MTYAARPIEPELFDQLSDGQLSHLREATYRLAQATSHEGTRYRYRRQCREFDAEQQRRSVERLGQTLSAKL